MSIEIHSGKKTLVLTSILIAVFLLVTVYTSQIAQASVLAQGQDDPSTMRELLESLHESVEADGNFTFTLHLQTPFIGEGETIIHIPANDGETSFERAIFSIGDEHVCFAERSGQYPSVRCTPFSNIVEVVYTEIP